MAISRRRYPKGHPQAGKLMSRFAEKVANFDDATKKRKLINLKNIKGGLGRLGVAGLAATGITAVAEGVTRKFIDPIITKKREDKAIDLRKKGDDSPKELQDLQAERKVTKAKGIQAQAEKSENALKSATPKNNLKDFARTILKPLDIIGQKELRTKQLKEGTIRKVQVSKTPTRVGQKNKPKGRYYFKKNK